MLARVPQLASRLGHLHQEGLYLLGLIPSLGDLEDRFQATDPLPVLVPVGDGLQLLSHQGDEDPKQCQSRLGLSARSTAEDNSSGCAFGKGHRQGNPIAEGPGGVAVHDFGKQLAGKTLPGTSLGKGDPSAFASLGDGNEGATGRKQDGRKRIGQVGRRIGGPGRPPQQFRRRNCQRGGLAKPIERRLVDSGGYDHPGCLPLGVPSLTFGCHYDNIISASIRHDMLTRRCRFEQMYEPLVYLRDSFHAEIA
jgi:hypothetical protein